MLEIPLSSDAPHFSQEHQVFGKHYIFEFEWIEREGYWVMHLYDQAEQAIALGLKVTTGWPVFMDSALNLGLMLTAKNPNVELNVKTFQEFILVAYALV